MKPQYKCKVCKTKMNVYWFGIGNRLSSYYSSYLNSMVKGIATCPKCYHMEDVIEEKQASNG